MSVVTKQLTNPKKVAKNTGRKSYSLRINIDPELAEFIDTYNQKYSSLNRPDVVKVMLLDLRHQQKIEKRKSFVDFMNTLPKPKKLYSEEEIFKILEEEDLL